MADPRHLSRLLTILLENAAKYTPSGGSVRLALILEKNLATFLVSDTGIGIPLQDQQLIFRRFCRGSNVQQSPAYGSGLGLALAAWIAEHHQTAITVESAVGSGSTFSWTLPLLPPLPSEMRGCNQGTTFATFEEGPLIGR